MKKKEFNFSFFIKVEIKLDYFNYFKFSLLNFFTIAKTSSGVF